MNRGHDALPDPPPPEPGVLRLRIDPTFGEIGLVKLRTSRELARPVLDQLEADGADASLAPEFGLASDLIVIAVAMRDNGAWMTLRTAIEALASRNKDKRIRFELGDSSVELDGYGDAQVERLMGAAHRQFDERARNWQEMNRRMDAAAEDNQIE